MVRDMGMASFTLGNPHEGCDIGPYIACATVWERRFAVWQGEV